MIDAEPVTHALRELPGMVSTVLGLLLVVGVVILALGIVALVVHLQGKKRGQ